MMMLRTPPPKKQRHDITYQSDQSPGTRPDQQLVIYEDPSSPVPLPELSQDPSGHMLCTYQCRQMVKSEFLDSLNTAEKKVRDYESKLETMNENFCKVDAERKNFLEKFLYTEQELAAAKARERMLQEQLLKEVTNSEERLKKQMLANTKLEVKLQKESTLRLKAESSDASNKEKIILLDRKLANLSEDTERKKKHFQTDLLRIEEESKLSILKLTTDIKKMEQRARNAEKESELLLGELESLKIHLNECLLQKSEVEKKLSTFTYEEGTSNESTILVKHLQEQLRSFEAEVREARRLKFSHENIQLLKEKLLEEKGRREKAELEISRLQEFQIAAKRLEDELSSWKSIIQDIPGVMCYDDIPVKIASLQKELIVSTMKMGEANARIKQLEVILETAQIAKQNAETEATLAKEKAELLKSDTERIELQLLMVTEERDRLRSLLKELNRSKNEETEHAVSPGSLVQELESSLADKELTIKELENRLNEQKEVNNRQHQDIKGLNERLNNEAKQRKSLERESDRLRAEISLLESKLGHGDFSAANTKILRMVNTLGLDNEAKQTIEALQTELQKTKEKLQAVEELKGGQSSDSGKLVDSYISGKIVQLKEHIATLEKREERYKTVFADRISVFRRACCELFGYKIVMDEHPRSNGIPVTRFILQSIFAQSDDEKLEFEYESGNTIILANDYTSQPDISKQVEIFIRKLNSIPAFTANLTVESFNRRTLC